LKTFAHYSETRDNNFNLVRFIAASLVIFSHSYPLTLGRGTPEPLSSFLGMSAGHLAVNIFFVVSGFLISKSFCDRNHLLTFLYARCLRIFPALIVIVLFCVLIIGVLFTQLPLSDYFLSDKTYKYIIKNVTLVFFSLQYALPGVFSDTVYPLVVNGSLWTLPIEVRMYLLVALTGFIGVLHKKYLFNILVLLSALFYIYTFFSLEISTEALRLSGFFLVGTFCYINRKEIPLNGYILLGIITLAIIFRFWQTSFFGLFFCLLIVHATFWFSLVPAGFIRRFNEIGDFSYGLYIYAFPIQQVIATLYTDIQPLEMLTVSFFVTLLCAYLSWHWIEKPVLTFK